jgi:hypothetical protein
MIPYVSPEYQKTAFNCPHCQAFADQRWLPIPPFGPGSIALQFSQDLMVAFCRHCGKYSMWLLGKMIYPDDSGVLLPNEDLEEKIQIGYMEARSILNKSPRGAAALLRLCVQQLCMQLGESGDNLNTDIGNLVQKGLSPTIQQSLDIVRVIGNNAVHPGQMDITDNVATANRLFELINLITETMITTPKKIADLYTQLPEQAKNQIERRDRTT